VPRQQVRPDPSGRPGCWESTGDRPQLVLRGPLRPGWHHVRLKMTSEVVGRVGLHALHSDDAGDAECLERFEVVDLLDRALYVRLDRPAAGLRLDPLDGPGRFRLDVLRVTRVPGPSAAALAVWHKVRLLLLHRVLGRTLRNGLRLLLTGRLGEIRRKVLMGLPSQNAAGADARFDELRLVAEQPLSAPAPRRPAARGRPFWVSGSIAGVSGYDNVVFEVTRGLHSLGLNVRLNAKSGLDYQLVPRPFLDLLGDRRADEPELVIAPPPLLGEFYRPGPHSAVLTMWESSRLDPEWVAWLIRARVVFVPSRWGVDCFLASGVRAPLVKVPLGHDPLVFHDNNDFPDRCAFGTAAALRDGGVRKNARLLVELFRRAFPTEPDVRLKVKLTPKCPPLDPGDPRVEVSRTLLTPLALAKWYRSLSAFVSASHAEGFGLHLVEAMACGRPVVSTRYSAVRDYFDEAIGYPVAHAVVPASGGRYTGHWALPSEAGLVEQMRQVYRDPAGARDRGRRAAARARLFTWKATAHRLARALEEHGVL
jgi:glycosyltransferase involved in cell wall biosynthesis